MSNPTIPTSLPEIEIRYMRNDNTNYLPLPGRHTGDVGLDLAAAIPGPITLGRGVGQFIPGGFRVQFGFGWAGLILPRSSINRKGLHVCTGVIDNGYTGELGTEVRNISNEEITVYPGDRLSQLVLIPGFRPKPVEVKYFQETDRGEKGFGSTG